MHSKYCGLLIGSAVLASTSLIAAPIASAVPARQVSDVDWSTWKRVNTAYEGRFGRAYSVGMFKLERPSSTFFLIYQVRNTSSVIFDAKCDVKTMSSGQVVYSIDQRLRPGEVSDLSGAGTMENSHEGDNFTAHCVMKVPML